MERLLYEMIKNYLPIKRFSEFPTPQEYWMQVKPRGKREMDLGMLKNFPRIEDVKQVGFD